MDNSCELDSDTVQLRDECTGDNAQIKRWFYALHEKALLVAGLNEAQVLPLIEMQFRSYCQMLDCSYPGARRLILELGDKAIGRIIVDEKPNLYYLVDIVIDESLRGSGIGSNTLGKMCQQADLESCRIELKVARDNPARSLYQRLGFVNLSCGAQKVVGLPVEKSTDSMDDSQYESMVRYPKS